VASLVPSDVQKQFLSTPGSQRTTDDVIPVCKAILLVQLNILQCASSGLLAVGVVDFRC
jgi:hypothetical protein